MDAESIGELRKLIVNALALADRLNLTDVALKLDGPRVRLEVETGAERQGRVH